METINYRGYDIEIKFDDLAENPRTEWDNLGKMVCFHNRYNLGDDHGFDSIEEFKKFLESDFSIVWLPLYLYDHSGITMNTSGFSCNWDSGQVGAIYFDMNDYEENMFTPEWLEKNHKGKTMKEVIITILQGEVEVYDQYLTGQVFYYNIEDVSSCGCFYGSNFEENGLLEYARNEIDCHIKIENERQNKARKELSRQLVSKKALSRRKKPVRA